MRLPRSVVIRPTASEINNNGTASGINSNAALEISSSDHLREGGFRPAPGPGHGHLPSAVSVIIRQAVSDRNGSAVSGMFGEARKCGFREGKKIEQ
jgi:hypothetical protein